MVSIACLIEAVGATSVSSTIDIVPCRLQAPLMWLRAVGKIAIDDRTRRDQAMTPDRNALDHHGAGSDVRAVADGDRAGQRGAGRDVHASRRSGSRDRSRRRY